MRSGRSIRWSAALLSAPFILGGCEEVTVTVVGVAEVEIQPVQTDLKVGETFRLNAILRDGSGNPLPGRPVHWSTDNPAIADVTVDGVVVAQSPGVVPIRASTAGVDGSAQIRVLMPASIVVDDFVRFEGRVGEPNPPSQLLPISNGGEAPLSELALTVLYPTGGPTGWLTAGLQESGGSTGAALAVSGTGLAAGTVTAVLQISSPLADNSPVQVEVEFQLAAPSPSIQLSAASLGFPWETGQPAPLPVTVDVWNGGSGELSGLAVSVVHGLGQPTGWLDARLKASVAPTELDITAVPGTLPNGSYTARVLIASLDAINSPRELIVRLTIGDPAPQISVSPGGMVLFATAGESPGPTVHTRIENSGGGTLSGLTATVEYPQFEASGWLSAELPTSTAPVDLILRTDAGNLAVGPYAATVKLEAPEALNSPQILDVIFHVGAAASPAESEIDAVPTTVTADGTSTATITVRLRDSSGVPLQFGGNQVAVSATTGQISPVEDRGDGTYRATLTAPTTIGIATVTGVIDGKDMERQAQVVFAAGEASAEHSYLTVEVLESVQALQVTSVETRDFRVTVHLRDQWENPLGRGGDVVSVSSSAGALSPVVDNDDGTYSATLQVPVDVETFTVSGTVNDLPISESATVEPPEEEDPGEEDPGEEDPGEEDPGEEDPGEEDPPLPEGPIVSVAAITYWTTGGSNSSQHLRIVLTLADESGDPVPGATVSTELRNTDAELSWTLSGTSDSGGTVTFALNNHPDGCYVTRVASVIAGDRTWDGETPSNGFCDPASGDDE